MAIGKYLLPICFFLSSCFLFGQEKILFKVEDEPVLLDEFLYIYNKTNRNQADYSRASVEEYLDLYTKFKLKVYKARQMQLDTISGLNNELAGYRKQLAQTYLADKEVTQSLVKEAWERMQKDINFSHILFKISANASSQDSLKVYERALAALDRLRSGEDFQKVAIELSEDETVRTNRGRVGYVTAMLPDGFYELETTLYNIPTRVYSRPVKSKLGYHIVVKNSERDARGEMEVAHILIRDQPGKSAKSRIDSIYAKLKNGADFDELAKNFSEDKMTAPKGGYLGFFGINKYESIFENTAFRLREDGDISKPIKTSIGWHVIKRISRKPVGSFDEIRRTLEAKIKRDSRFRMAEESLIDKIKTENKFQEFSWDKNKFIGEIGNDFLQYRWKRPETATIQKIFSIKDQIVTTEDLLQFMEKNTASRLRINRRLPKPEAIDLILHEFSEKYLMEFEEKSLENKYPEFKALMREYEEGILLFEATKMKVWDRASNDSAGLAAYHKDHKEAYMWPERAQIETFQIRSVDQKVIDKVKKQLFKKSSQKILNKFNKKKELITLQSQVIEKENMDHDLSWTSLSMSAPFINKEKEITVIKRVGQIIPPTMKSLDEARGYIIADYQDYLEKEWIHSLQEEFKVEVNQEVLNSIIKK